MGKCPPVVVVVDASQKRFRERLGGVTVKSLDQARSVCEEKRRKVV